MVSQSSRKKPQLGRIRRATLDDAADVSGLLSEANVVLFRLKEILDIKVLIETCVLSIVHLDTAEKVIGFMALTDHPLLPGIHPSAWEDFVWAKYKLNEMNARNTLFVYLLAWDLAYSKEMAVNMLRSVFMHDAYLHYVVLTKPRADGMPLSPDDACMENIFKRTPPAHSVRGVPTSHLPTLFVAGRPDVCPKLRIRRAVEEDNDDIVPIVDLQSERLRELYGDFYISELVSRHPDSNRVLLVAEHKQVAVGIMVLNTTINYEQLENNFELGPYCGLRQPSFVDHMPAAVHPIVDDDLLVESRSNSVYMENVKGSPVYNENLRDQKPRVSFSRPSDVFDVRVDSGLKSESPGLKSETPSLLMTGSRPNYIDQLANEEELEFEIVNIDNNLLHVPHMLSYESFLYDTESIESIQKELQPRVKSITELLGKRSAAAAAMASASNQRWSDNSWRRKSEGLPNAFLIELFAMHPDYDERYGFDMLEVAYEVFPECSYCVLALPTDHVAYPLLEHFTPVTPMPCREVLFDHSLYVAHRNSVRGRVHIRSAEQMDLTAVSALLEHAARRSIYLEMFNGSLDSHTIHSYMLLSENKPVGVVILGSLEDALVLRSRYTLGVTGGSEGAIAVGVLSPALEPHARWYARELLRHSQYEELTWTCRLSGRGDAIPCRNLMSLTGRMVPIMPRRPVPGSDTYKDTEINGKNKNCAQFAMWQLTRPLTSVNKVDVNRSIVVVGASRTGLAFIETLLFGPSSAYLTFNNVTLISTNGLPIVSEIMCSAAIFIPHSGRYDCKYFKMVPFYFYIDVVAATMVQIDRQKKCIKLHPRGIKYYDDLFLTCGEQFQHPLHLRAALDREREFEMGAPCIHRAMDDPEYKPDALPTSPVTPDNVFMINSIVDATRALRHLLHMLNNASSLEAQSDAGKVAVYGDCLQAYCCIAALLDMGLSPKRINYIEPFPPDDPSQMRVNHFNNEIVDGRVQKSLEGTGVTCYRCYSLIDWSVWPDGRVRALKLLTRHKAIKLPCLALFYYGVKTIDINLFSAINSCGLVYDGGLVVTPQFETNDPFIFGAGRSTRYSRQLHADRYLHRHYWSEDVGAVLGEMMLRKLDPFVSQAGGSAGDSKECKSSNASDNFNNGTIGSDSSMSRSGKLPVVGKFRPKSVPKFKSPIMQCCKLPGELYYMHVRAPGPMVPMEVFTSMESQGHTLTTDKDFNYFRLQLDVHHKVSCVTCLSRKPIPDVVLAQLYGKHERMLNNLLIRFESGKIDDLYEYFDSPWLIGLWQDDFKDLQWDIDNLDINTDDEQLGTFKDFVTKMMKASDDPQLERSPNAELRSKISQRWAALGMEEAVLGRLADWLRDRRYHLPSFAEPTHVPHLE